MKINWGTGIAIFYTFFVFIMISMVVKSCHHKSHLVEEAYYESDLNYEKIRKARENGLAYKDQFKLKFNHSKNELYIQFPNQVNASGDIQIFRPSNKFLDLNYPIKLNEKNEAFIDIRERVLPGYWKVKINWTANEINHFNEFQLNI
jgi:hypothetical protein